MLYDASDLVTAIAERYKHRRAVHLADPDEPVVYSWHATRTLRMADLAGPGALRLGASHAICSGPRSVARAWGRALHATWPGPDGICYSSSMNGRSCAALWAPARTTFPAAPDFSALLSLRSRAWQSLVDGACAGIGYDCWP
ncbi:MAG: RES family NAD+ phosphorylase [Acidimicrobiales bacterium]